MSKLREEFYEFLKSVTPPEPCEFCGRCVFVGPPCCEELVEKLKKPKESPPL